MIKLVRSFWYRMYYFRPFSQRFLTSHFRYRSICISATSLRKLGLFGLRPFLNRSLWITSQNIGRIGDVTGKAHIEVKSGQIAALMKDYRFDFNKLKFWIGRLHLTFDLLKNFMLVIQHFPCNFFKIFGAENFYLKPWSENKNSLTCNWYENSRTRTSMSAEP